jgi:hypothetical protein
MCALYYSPENSIRWTTRKGLLNPSGMGRKPTISPVRTITVPLAAQHVKALESFRSAYGLSSFTEALRVSSWRWLMQEGLVRPGKDKSGNDSET